MSEFILLSPILERADDQLFFLCPGCEMLHGVNVNRSKSGPGWDWNGDANKPTFSPSILCRSYYWTPRADLDPEVARLVREGKLTQTKVDTVCHSFITDGRIEFLSDCTHALAGQTVGLPEIGDY